MKLNIGSGFKKMEGYTNIDNNEKTVPDVFMDIEKSTLPFANNTVDEVVASMVFEHVSNLEYVLEELYRVMRNGAILKVTVPFMNSQVALNHVRVFDDNCFKGWSKEWYESKEGQNTHQYSFDFKTTKLDVIGNRIGTLINSHTWHMFWQCFLTSIYVELEAVKRGEIK